jgi:hypothetical protein
MRLSLLPGMGFFPPQQRHHSLETFCRTSELQKPEKLKDHEMKKTRAEK